MLSARGTNTANELANKNSTRLVPQRVGEDFELDASAVSKRRKAQPRATRVRRSQSRTWVCKTGVRNRKIEIERVNRNDRPVHAQDQSIIQE